MTMVMSSGNGQHISIRRFITFDDCHLPNEYRAGAHLRFSGSYDLPI